VKLVTISVQTSYKTILARVVILASVILLVAMVYREWAAFVSTTIEWQKSLHAMLASHIGAVSEDAVRYGGALIALSFGYGVFHAIGPGHGKAVIVTYLGTSKETAWKGIFISFSAAILQSVIAIILVSVLARVLSFKLSEVHNYGNDMALVSYVLVSLLGFMLVVGSIRRMIKSSRSNGQREHLLHIGHEHGHHNHNHDDHSESSHSHSSNCGCSHTHVPDQHESKLQTLAVIFSMGFRPCSGAIVVLIYAHLVGVYSYGVIATLMMGLGTGLSVSVIAVVTLYARAWLERFLAASDQSGGRLHDYISHCVRLFGGVVLIVLGWSFYRVASAISAGHPLF